MITIMGATKNMITRLKSTNLIYKYRVQHQNDSFFDKLKF